MVLNGAKGVTEQELRHLCNIHTNANLHHINSQLKSILKSVSSNDNHGDNAVMKLANLLLVKNDSSMKTDYRHIMTDAFHTNVDSVNFTVDKRQTIDKINNWVSDQTNGKIKDLFNGELSDDTAMVLVNAIYFKGIWKYLFNKTETHKSDFHDMGRPNTIQVDMMSMKRKFAVKYVKGLDATMFEMPFNGHMSMFILLPEDVNGLDSMTTKLTVKALNDNVFSITKRKGLTNTLLFPKFKLESEYDLKDSLSRLGAKSMFEDSADFSGINGQRTLKISKAIHKAHIDVNEEGAEAAAVSKFVFVTRTYRRDYITVDRPFMFAIIDKSTGLIWFMGQIRTLS